MTESIQESLIEEDKETKYHRIISWLDDRKILIGKPQDKMLEYYLKLNSTQYPDQKIPIKTDNLEN